MRNIAIIPARSGSKGLPDKNIKPLCGKPLMAYSIEAALKAGIYEVVHVSTDSEVYAEIGREYGADVPFLRSAEMSGDTAGSWDVVLEVLENYKKRGKEFDMVTLLQPTSPLRNEHDIVDAYHYYVKISAKAVISLCETDHSPLWCNTLPEDGSMEGFNNNRPNLPRQLLPRYYRYNGAIYMVDIPFLQADRKLDREGCFAYIMDKSKSIDIDTAEDFEFAEWYMSRKA